MQNTDISLQNKSTNAYYEQKKFAGSKRNDQDQIRQEFRQKINDGLSRKSIAADVSLPKSRVVEFGEDEYAEYEPVIGNKIRDLNKERNFAVETMKKNWNERKAIHYKIRDQHPVQKYASQVDLRMMTQYQKSFLKLDQADDFEIPIIGSSKAISKDKIVKKRKTKKRIPKRSIIDLNLRKSSDHLLDLKIDLRVKDKTEPNTKRNKFQ